MLKKMMLLATAIAALAAFAMPTVANAQQLKEGGVALAVNSTFTATSTNLQTHTLLGPLSCKKVTLHLTVNANTAATSRATASSATTEGCFLNGEAAGDPVTITDPKTTAHVHLTGPNAGKPGFTFIADIYTKGLPHILANQKGECHIETQAGGTTGTNGSITWVAGSSTINVKAPTAGPCGPAELTGAFTVETSNGAAVTVS